MPRPQIPRLALARVGAHGIFLDSRRDRYFALPPSENAGLLDLLDGNAVTPESASAIAAAIDHPADPALLQALLPPPVAAPMRCVSDSVPAPLGTRLAALWHVLSCALILRTRGLHAGLARITRHRTTRATDAAALSRIVAAHRWVSRHVSPHDACLLRSLALARHAGAHAADLRLIVAVKVDPFAAHCWVQVGEVALNEDPDLAAIFQPILVVP